MHELRAAMHSPVPQSQIYVKNGVVHTYNLPASATASSTSTSSPPAFQAAATATTSTTAAAAAVAGGDARPSPGRTKAHSVALTGRRPGTGWTAHPATSRGAGRPKAKSVQVGVCV